MDDGFAAIFFLFLARTQVVAYPIEFSERPERGVGTSQN